MVAGTARLALADLNGDGTPDLAASSHLGSLTILLNRGDGTFAVGGNYVGASVLDEIAIGDLNRDGKPDLTVVGTVDNGVMVFLNNSP